jgi:predicted AlkP superfamily pyrophosphatase or phosphodiesterase
MTILITFFFVVVAWSQPHPITDLQPTVLLISIDGFRYDYFEKTATPNFDRLIKGGTKAKWLIPQFPTKTFPNHYTVVTGLRPENHGIVSNTMYDPEFNEGFSLGNVKAVRDAKWWGGEPLWVTAEKQGQRAATYFWPGSEAGILGVHPSYGKEYNHSVPDSQRVTEVLGWLDLPREGRPTFITLYFAVMDDAGHRFGPDSSALVDAIQGMDHVVGYLLDGLQRRAILDRINIILVSDHGMSQTSSERVIFIDDYTDSSEVRIVDRTPIAQLWPKPGKEDAVYNRIAGAHPRLSVYRKVEIPERWHFRNHRRIAPIIAVADDGWTITTRSARRRDSGGDHGYDNALESMRAIFVASGPAFRQGVVVEPLENIHIYELMCFILKLKPAPNDGILNTVRSLLK